MARKFDDIYPFNKGIATVRVGDNYGCINLKGEFVLSPRFDDAFPFGFSEGLLCVGVKK